MFDISNTVLYELAYETAVLLQKAQTKLRQIKWSDGESNTDTEYSELACKYCRKAWLDMRKKYNDYKKVVIKCNPPDIDITFTLNKISIKKHIELKSSKVKTLLGSTINTLNVNQPLIFCLRPSSDHHNKANDGKNKPVYQIRYSKYYHAIGKSDFDKFQDRTPRPYVNFSRMFEAETMFVKDEEFTSKDDWVEHYSQCALNRLNDVNCKKSSWQDDMIECIKRKILEEFIHETTISNYKKIKKELLEKIKVKN